MTGFYMSLLRSTDQKKSSLKMFYVRSDKIDFAIEKILSTAVQLGLKSPVLVHIDPCRFDQLDPNLVSSVNDEVYVSKNSYSFPTEPIYFPSYGVVSSFREGSNTVYDIKPGWKLKKIRDCIYELLINVSPQDLASIYFLFLKNFISIKAFWVTLSKDWDDFEADEYYVSKDLANYRDIRSFIENNFIDVVSNGHVGIATYLSQGSTHFNIENHKYIRVLSKDLNTIKVFCHILEKNSISNNNDFVCFDNNIYHWHYMDARGKERSAFSDFLVDQGFKKQ
ncbi:hypothetical protein KR51_00037330 [Rubidibacter lacunae KORDI 51-2]|uniref:Uncharacterized protein n=1 Tax=Rubidibacter lacunae KORDI 51-2 TaxID=582515 RepID=U5DEU1_9CHRO|nr:hypothetical protein [Rubidibacter lacunae]ERN39817.1 hypothetical protein KR51_00037330 [Rubidibacter lacunae KORDI 51-2]